MRSSLPDELPEKKVTITDEDGSKRDFYVRYKTLSDSHLELEPHIRFTETWDEIEYIFDDEGHDITDTDPELEKRISDAFYGM